MNDMHESTDKPVQTWTFVGHWENDRIVVEYVLEGDVDDVRIDAGYWEQGLWAAAGSGTDMAETQAAVIAEYEASEYEAYHDTDCAGPGVCDGCGYIDSTLTWRPGPCPEADKPYQSARSEGTPEPTLHDKEV